MAKRPQPGRSKPATKREVQPPTPLVSMPALARWLLPGMALLLFFASWIRFAQVAANNRPPLRMLVMQGDEPWPDRALLRVRCAFNGQFISVGDRVWIPCATGPRTWELIRWDFHRGVAERRWRVTRSPKHGSAVEIVPQHGLHLPPIIAAAVLLSGGDLALVMHGPKPLTPVELIIVRREGGLSHYPLSGIKPGALTGFAHVRGRYELLTADCRRHVLEPGKPLVSSPLAGCPYDGKTVLEWSQRKSNGWRIVYARQAKIPGHYALFLVEPGAEKARPIGSLREATRITRGEKLDMTPGNVLPVGTSQWPTHRMVKGAPQPLEGPPQGLLVAPGQTTIGAKHIILLDSGSMRRLHAWHSIGTSAPPGATGTVGGQTPRTTTRRSRWLSQQPTRWIAGESLDRQQRLRLAANAPDRTQDISLPRAAPTVMNAIPARGGGTWLFDGLGTYLKVDDGLRRTDTPGLVDRVRRVWRRHHLQRRSLYGPPGHPEKQSRLLGLAHRAALPGVLLGLPLLLLITLPFARRVGRRLDPTRPLRASFNRPVWPWIVTATLYLFSAGALLWPFWQVTSAF